MDSLVLVLGWVGIIAPLALGAMGSAVASATAGQAASGALLEVESGYGRYIGLSAMPSSQVIYGIVVTLSLNRTLTIDNASPTNATWGSVTASDVSGTGTILNDDVPLAIAISDVTLAEGNDVTFLATGETVSRAVMAGQILGEEGIDAGVISLHSLRPLDEAAVLEAARRSAAVITVEEHSVFGGLGSTVAALLMQKGINKPFKIVGIPDEYTVTGSQSDIFAHYGISMEGLVATAREVLNGVA